MDNAALIEECLNFMTLFHHRKHGDPINLQLQWAQLRASLFDESRETRLASGSGSVKLSLNAQKPDIIPEAGLSKAQLYLRAAQSRNDSIAKPSIDVKHELQPDDLDSSALQTRLNGIIQDIHSRKSELQIISENRAFATLIQIAVKHITNDHDLLSRLNKLAPTKGSTKILEDILSARPKIELAPKPKNTIRQAPSREFRMLKTGDEMKFNDAISSKSPSRSDSRDTLIGDWVAVDSEENIMTPDKTTISRRLSEAKLDEVTSKIDSPRSPSHYEDLLELLTVQKEESFGDNPERPIQLDSPQDSPYEGFSISPYRRPSISDDLASHAAQTGDGAESMNNAIANITNDYTDRRTSKIMFGADVDVGTNADTNVDVDMIAGSGHTSSHFDTFVETISAISSHLPNLASDPKTSSSNANIPSETNDNRSFVPLSGENMLKPKTDEPAQSDLSQEFTKMFESVNEANFTQAFPAPPAALSLGAAVDALDQICDDFLIIPDVIPPLQGIPHIQINSNDASASKLDALANDQSMLKSDKMSAPSESYSLPHTLNRKLEHDSQTSIEMARLSGMTFYNRVESHSTEQISQKNPEDNEKDKFTEALSLDRQASYTEPGSQVASRSVLALHKSSESSLATIAPVDGGSFSDRLLRKSRNGKPNNDILQKLIESEMQAYMTQSNKITSTVEAEQSTKGTDTIDAGSNDGWTPISSHKPSFVGRAVHKDPDELSAFEQTHESIQEEAVGAGIEDIDEIDAPGWLLDLREKLLLVQKANSVHSPEEEHVTPQLPRLTNTEHTISDPRLRRSGVPPTIQAEASGQPRTVLIKVEDEERTMSLDLDRRWRLGRTNVDGYPQFSGGHVLLADLGSTAGTFLNGLRLSVSGVPSKRFIVRQDDIITLGTSYTSEEELVVHKSTALKIVSIRTKKLNSAENPAQPITEKRWAAHKVVCFSTLGKLKRIQVEHGPDSAVVVTAELKRWSVQGILVIHDMRNNSYSQSIEIVRNHETSGTYHMILNGKPQYRISFDSNVKFLVTNIRNASAPSYTVVDDRSQKYIGEAHGSKVARRNLKETVREMEVELCFSDQELKLSSIVLALSIFMRVCRSTKM